MEVPEKVSRIQSYIQSRSRRAVLEKQVASLRKQLSGLEEELAQVVHQEQEKLSCIDQSMLVDRKSVKVISDLLSAAAFIRIPAGEFPVGCALLTREKGGQRLSVVFSQPLFSGWRTEKPYVSFQPAPAQLETPGPPSENHIPQYIGSVEQDLDLDCWEHADGEVRLWAASGVVVFVLRENGTA